MDIISVALDALASAMVLILHPEVFMFLGLGVVLGLSVGIFPGLGGIAGLSLMLPFIFGLDPIIGLALMIGLIAVVPTSDTFASVLMGIPGSSSSQATVLDGFPMSKQGHAARALSAAFASSLFGGLVGALFLTMFILVARPIVLEFQSPELLMVSIFGLSMVGILAGKIPLKGVAAAGLGIMVASIGEGPFNGELRLVSYEVPYLLDGFKLVIVGLGIFAIPEIVALLRKGGSISKQPSLGSGWLTGIKDWWINRWLSIRCSIIGVLVGVIPGLGGSVVDWIAYGHSIQTTSDKSNFGKGEIRGVIAPESANNAKEGGGLVPTLLFGIPGSGSMAIFIGALALLGSGELEVGQSMLTDNLDYTYGIVWLLAIANVLGTVLCIILAPQIARLTSIRFVLVAPFVFMIITFAAFQSGQDVLDLVVLFCIGILGILMRRFDWSRPAFLIGFVLANPVENFSNNAYQIAGIRFENGFSQGLDYLFGPIVIVIAIITVISIVIGIRQAKFIQPEGQLETGTKRAPLTFLLGLIAFTSIFLFNIGSIPDYAWTDAVFPFVIGCTVLIILLYLMTQMMLKPESDPLFVDGEIQSTEANEKPLWSTIGWFIALLAGTALVGFIISLAIFLLCFFAVRANLKWPRTVFMSVCGVCFMIFMGWILNREFPGGLLQFYIALPWPLR